METHTTAELFEEGVEDCSKQQKKYTKCKTAVAEHPRKVYDITLLEFRLGTFLLQWGKNASANGPFI